MFGRKARPVIGNLITGSGHKPGVYDLVTSPKSPLEFIKIQSPRGVNNYGGAVGVGLGIVAALEKNSVPSSVINTEQNDLEEYTYVTCYGRNKMSKVYYDGCEISRNINHRVCVFKISPETSSLSNIASDFLSSCDMCLKKLHGQDIYMYRGEKAYCSTECRERQIVMDEKKENEWASSRSNVADHSTSTYTATDLQKFSTGIFAI